MKVKSYVEVEELNRYTKVAEAINLAIGDEDVAIIYKLESNISKYYANFRSKYFMPFSMSMYIRKYINYDAMELTLQCDGNPIKEIIIRAEKGLDFTETNGINELVNILVEYSKLAKGLGLREHM